MFSPRHNDNNNHPHLNFPLSTHIDRMEHIAIICICILPIISYNMQHINQIVIKKSYEMHDAFHGCISRFCYNMLAIKCIVVSFVHFIAVEES